MDLSKLETLDIVLVCGLPGSGKSAFSKQYFSNSGRDRVNRKEIHRLLYEMIHFGKRWTEKEIDELEEELEAVVSKYR